MLRVGVAGVLGRMGRVAAAAVESASDLELRAGFDRVDAARSLRDAVGRGPDDARIYDDLDAFVECGLDVIIDFTTYPISTEIARVAVRAGVSPVIGATGWMDEDVVSFADAVDEAGIGALIVPNFALGAVLMMRFAEEAAKHLKAAEIIEMHHDAKVDAPSGTATLTAQRMTSAGLAHVPIHSVRLPGLVAHQAVMFGARGETLTIRHDAIDRDVYLEGIALAARRVRSLKHLAIGLDVLLFGEDDPMEGPL